MKPFNNWPYRKTHLSTIYQWVSRVLILAMALYLIHAFTWGDLKTTLKQIEWQVYRLSLFYTFLLYFVSLAVQFVVWIRILSFHHHTSLQDMIIYARMILLRGLPGGIWHWLGRISMYASETEIPAQTVTLANFLEWVLFTLSGAWLFVITISGPWRYPLALFLGGTALILVIIWQPAHRRLLFRLLEGVGWLFLYIIAWLMGAAILYLIAWAVTPTGGLSPWEAFRAWTFTGSLGMLTAPLPSSLGIREITIVWWLQDQLTPAVALLIALILRVLYMVSDSLWGIVIWVICILLSQRTPPLPHDKDTFDIKPPGTGSTSVP